MSVADSAVGAILDIPAEALRDIKKAESAIWSLHDASKKAADQIYGDFSQRMPRGIDVFLNKLKEARDRMDGLGTINVTLNTNAAIQSTEQLSTATQKTSADVSKAVQDMAQSWNDLSKVSLKGFDPTDYGNNITEIKLKLQELKKESDNLFVKGSTNQSLNDEIRQIEEFIRLYKLATEEKNKALSNVQQRQQNQTDKAYLDEQKRLLSDILDLRKQVNGQKIVVAQGQVTGSSTLEQDKKILSELIARLYEAKDKLKDYNAEKYKNVSAEGQTKAQINTLNQENALIKEQMSFRDKLNTAIARGNELTAQTQASKARLGNTDEAIAQRQLNSDYKEMLKIIKEQGELKAKVASEGRQMNQDEINLIATLAQRYKNYYEDVKRVASAYTNMSEASARAFESDKSAQLARNAVLLADAQNKAMQDAQKRADAESKAEERAIAAGARKIAQKEAQIAKQEAANQKAAQDYEKWWLSALGKVEAERAKNDEARNAQRKKQAEQDAARIANARANAEKEVNDILNKRIELQQKITALNTKQKIAALSDPNAKLSFSDSANLAKYERQMQSLEDRLNKIRTHYPQLARDSDRAFNTQKADLLALSLQKINEEYTKIASGKSTATRDSVEENLNRLYTERLRLLKEKEQLENKALVNTAKGLPDLTAKENQLLAEVTAKIQRIDGQIKNIGNSYAGLALKTKNAYALDELRQATTLQNQFNKAIDAVDANRAKKLTSEYTQLTKRLQEVNDAMNRFQASGGNVNSASFQALQNEWQSIMARRKEIERMNIAEVNQYRYQMAQSAYQQDLSTFVQNEAQKTAEAKKQADERARQQAESLNKYLNSAQGAMWYSRQLNKGNIDNSYENRERAIKQLESAIKSLDKNDKDYDKTLERLTRTLNILKNAQKEVTDAMKPTKPMVSPQDAINAAKNATSLRDLEKAYKQLKDVMSQTDPKSQKWADMNSQLQKTKTNIDEIKKKMGEFREQSTKTSNVVGQLQSRIATAFSIGAITGFIKKMVEVRAQFELQRVALGAIIQDRDEANKIFTQVQNMALESPFNIMQLEKATKQIAAFGFETQKLVPTMKMFADISAGLGVEIDRLVLVMGHLKARNFLEGTMVRQFTNMGFNVLGELSKYYTELEGKMVAVGEVQDRVKKKMVSFEDVEEVLKRVTSAGGMFYDMQKKQSESLWGQLQRIQDAYDLMLNSIGQSNESVLKDALAFIRSMINHWRVLAPIIKDIGYLMAAVFAVKGIKALLIGFTTLGTMLKRLPIYLRAIRHSIHSINMAWSTTGIGLLITMAVTAVEVFRGLRAESEALNEELGRIETEGVSNMYNLIFQYRQLADTIRDSNATYEERQKALDEVKRIYKDILPDQMLEIENIRKMKDGYDDATEAIKAYYAEKIKQQKIEAIDTEYGKEITEALDKQAKHFTKLIYSKIKDLPQLEGITEKQIQGAIRNIMVTIVEEVKNGDITMEQASDKFKEQFLNTFAISDEYYNSISEKMRGRLDNIFKKAFKGWKAGGDISFRVEGVEDVINKIEEAKGAFTELGSFTTVQNIQAQPVIEEYDGLKKAVDEYKKALIALRDEQEKGNVGGELKQSTSGALYAHDVKGLGQTALDNLNQAILNVQYAMQGFGSDFEITADQVNGALQSEVDQMEYFDKVNEQTFGNAIRNFNSFYSELKNNSFMQNMVEKWNTAWNELNMTEPQKKVAEFQRKIASDMGVSVDIFKRFKLESIKSYDAARKKAKELSDESAENIKRIASTRIELIKLGMSAADAQREAERIHGNGKTEEEIKQEQKALQSLSRVLGNYDKSKSGKSQDKELKRWQDLKKAIEDVSTAYDKYRKSFTVEESNKRIEELYGPAFKELGYDIKQFYKDGKYDAEELVKALEVLKGMTKATTEERKKFRSEIERKIGTTQVEIEVKMKEDAEKKLKADLDDMFASYELSEELKKIGVSVDLTYMVGGKPTTLEDIQNKIAQLKAESGGDESAENLIKIYEGYEKKITQAQLKEQKERLKNYQKYLVNAYGEMGKVQLDYYAKLTQMQEDFAKNEKDLQEQLTKHDTTPEQKLKIQKALENLPNQASRAAKMMREEMQKELDKITLDKLLKSPLFAEMFQDLGSMTNATLDKMKKKIEDIQKSANSLSLSQVRQLSQYAEKLENAKIDNSPFKEAAEAIHKAYELRRKGITAAKANDSLAISEEELERLETLKEDILLVLGLKEKSYHIDDDTLTVGGEQIKLTKQQKELIRKNTSELNEQLGVLEDQSGALDGSIKKQEQVVTANAQNVQVFKNAKIGTEKFGAALQEVAKLAQSAMDVIVSGLKLFGNQISDEDQVWIDFVSGMLSTCVTLGIAFVALGIEINSALGIIGLIATALSVVAGLFTAIFQAHDKRLEKQIENVQDRVDVLSKSFEKLEKSIERAFNIANENRLTKQALDNLDEQRQAYEEMIRLEEAKKKTDKEKIKDYNEKLEELAEAEQELYEKRHEKWGSTNDVWDEANNWVDAWLDAFKETGDGLDALNDNWDEFYENLVKKQATSAILGKRMQAYIERINDVIDSNMDEYGYVDAFKKIGEDFKKDSAEWNKLLKEFFEYAGIGGGAGELILSDLQKGIQNITEPQAAAIEAYLNSMRFAVFRHTEQLDTLITTIQMQYGSGAENPVVTELKGIRGVLDNIHSTLKSVVKTERGNTGVVILG